MCYVLAAVAVALVAFFAIKGLQASKREKAEAPAHFKAAQEAFDRGDAATALRELARSFFEADHYTAEEAQLELQVVALAEKIALQRGTNIQDVTLELKAALEVAAAAVPAGADVVTDHSATFKKFIAAAGQEPDKLVDALGWASTKFLTVDLEDAGPRSSGELTAQQSALITKSGRTVAFGGPDKAIQMLGEALAAGATGRFRIDLLSQRGGAHSIKGDHEASRADYQTCCDLEPDCSMHFTNLAEALEALGRRDEARAAAAKAVEVARTKSQRAGAEAIVRRLS
ncbi:MAG TPA: hypothetical protein VGK67_17730 [Myxococcales bacterium]|jgi:tetratricopeptide (TPR) repeat protein